MSACETEATPAPAAAEAAPEAPATECVDKEEKKAEAEDDCYVARAGAPLLLSVEDGEWAVFARAGAGDAPQRLSKRTPAVSLAPLLGSTYGSVYVVRDDAAEGSGAGAPGGGKRTRRLVGVVPRGAADESDDVAGAGAGAGSVSDNRNLVDQNTHQALTAEQIAALKRGGATGADIVRHLVENSATFQEKTVYAQEKYIRRKKQKHESVVVSLFPGAANVATAAFTKDPAKVAGLRPDSLARMLQKAGLAAGARALVCETCGGLLSAAVAERVGPAGAVYHVQCTARASPQRPHHVDHFRRPLAPVHPVSLAPHLRALVAPAPANPFAPPSGGTEVAAGVEEVPKCTALLVATKFDPVAVALALLPRLAGSGTLVVFCPFVHPLERIAEVVAGTLACDVEITETWTRVYQVLPQRTHPTMDMHGASGYILTATRLVQTDPRQLQLALDALRRYVPAVPVSVPQQQQQPQPQPTADACADAPSEAPAKKMRLDGSDAAAAAPDAEAAAPMACE